MEGEPSVRTRQYVRLPEDCVSLCTEKLGIQASREVTSALVEDVSFRIRQVTKLALEFAKHSNRKRINKEDFNNALKWSGIEPLYGHSTEPLPFMYIHENGLYCVEDQEIPLQELSLSCPVTPSNLPPPPSLSAEWLLVEGVPVEMEGSLHGLPATVQLNKPFNESYHKYLSLLMEAVTGESKEIHRIALNDIQTNPAVANILPDLVQYLLETLSCWVQFSPAQLMRVLKMLHSLFINKHLFLDPYGAAIFPLIKAILLTPSYLHSGPVSTHWHVRRMSAVCLAEIITHCATLLNEYVPDINTSFRPLLSQSDTPLQVLYGVVLLLCHLGGKNLSEVLFPKLDTVYQYVQSHLESHDMTIREAALKVHETLLLSAEILLVSGVSVEHISSSSSTSSLLQSHTLSSHTTTVMGGGGGGVGGHDNSFLSSFGPPGGKSLMDTSDLMPQGDIQQPTPSLYEFLVDLFGEVLVQKLTAYVKNLRATGEKKKSEVFNAHPPTEDNVSHKQLLHFLKMEGFRPYKVQLPLKPMPRKPPAYHPWGRQLWRFQIPTTLLPVWSNVLEYTRQKLRGRERTAVVPTKYYGRRRMICRTGNRTRYVISDLGVVL